MRTNVLVGPAFIRTRDNGIKLYVFMEEIYEFFFFYNEGVHTLEQVTQKEVGAPPLETLKAKVDRALRTLI